MKAAGFGVATALAALATLSAAPQRPTFSSRVLAVRVDAQVMDGRRPVPGLRAQDFVVLDNGVPQTVSLVDTAAAPINVVLAFDLSGSTSGRRLAELTSASELNEEDLAALRARRFPGRTSRGPTLDPLTAASGMMPPEVANAEAERLFRRALSLDAGYVDARIRLARLLIERTEYAEALKQLETAFQKDSDNVTTFYAHLFGGRANRALGRLAPAAGHYRAALTLFHEAQSALVGASQIALLQGEPERAMDAVRVLRAIGDDPSRGTDPWWHYRMGPGYKADPLWRETITMMEAR